MKLKHVAMISTALVIIAGLAMISPLFFQPAAARPKQKVMLGFSLTEQNNVMAWCEDLAYLLNRHGIGASLFLVGKLAEDFPDAVWYFGDEMDVGSRTFDNVNLTSISDYSIKLEEITEGKAAVDDVGTLYSRIFRAPYGATDRDIFSLLGRAGILADFSYDDHYNIYRNGQFVRYEAVTCQVPASPTAFIQGLGDMTRPLLVFLDNSQTIPDIDKVITRLEEADVEFVNASGLTGLDLTTRTR